MLFQRRIEHMWRCIVLLVTVAASSTLAGPQGACADPAATLYAGRAVYLTNGSLRSPDGSKTLIVQTASGPGKHDGNRLLFSIRLGKKQFNTQLAGFNAEVMWSPDSAAFGVTQTEGGGGIGYRVYLFFVGEDGIRRVDVSPVIEGAFRPPGKCEVPVRPNTALVDWLHGSERILVAAEVVPVSICECKGTFELYEVAVPGLRIERTYSQRFAKQKFWHSLGCELREAPDTCSGPVPHQ
jgi:hypothetical protein